LNVAGVVDSDLSHAAAISVRQHLVGAVTATHSNSFCQDLLQFRSSSARYQRPYQRQRIIVEVGLNTTSMPLTKLLTLLKLEIHYFHLANSKLDL